MTEQSIFAMADLATPMAIRVAATLSLVERAGGDGATAEWLAAQTGTAAAALGSVLDHLVTVGAFVRDGHRYRPTDLGDQLRGDRKPLLDAHCAGGRAELAFTDLLGTLTTGVPAYVTRYGRDFWADLDADPALRRSFDAQMNWRFRQQAPQIAERFDWGRFTEVVDVGGGNGIVLAEILRRHPTVRGRVLELPPTAEAATATFAEAGLPDRASAVGGSFFDPLPTGADVYLLSDILHDWDDDRARAILTRCREAAAPTGTIVMIEPLRENTAIDLFMLMCFGGRERTAAELTALADECALTLTSTTAVAEGRTALEFTVSR